MKILVAEHGQRNSQSLTHFLEEDGHQVLQAASSTETINLFAREKPDLVIMDIALPDGDGYHCSRRIASLTGQRFAPVILTASVSDHLTLDRFLDSQAVDFVDEPHNPWVLRAKIAGFERMQSVHAQLESHHARFRHEITLAKHMFDAVIGRSPEVDFLRHWTATAGHFCGDLLVYEKGPAGDLYILMGDFTGHGLAAAVGALPTAETFFAMARKGCDLSELAAEMNGKIHRLLPTGHFCAATLVRLHVAESRLDVWNGGQPPLLFIGRERRILNQVPSFHFPLGVMGEDRFDAAIQTFAMDQVQHLVLCSDGLLEAQNAGGEMFGEAGLQDAVVSAARSAHLLQAIKSRLIAFLNGSEPHDDISLVTMDVAPAT